MFLSDLHEQSNFSLRGMFLHVCRFSVLFFFIVAHSLTFQKSKDQKCQRQQKGCSQILQRKTPHRSKSGSAPNRKPLAVQVDLLPGLLLSPRDLVEVSDVPLKFCYYSPSWQRG